MYHRNLKRHDIFFSIKKIESKSTQHKTGAKSLQDFNFPFGPGFSLLGLLLISTLDFIFSNQDLTFGF